MLSMKKNKIVTEEAVKKPSSLYARQSATFYKQLDEEIMDELSYYGRPCTKRCQGHDAGNKWQKRAFANMGTIPVATKLANALLRVSNPKHPSFNTGTDIASDHLLKGIKTISGGVKDDTGRFTKYTGPIDARFAENYATNDHLGFGERPDDTPVIEQRKSKKRKK